MLRIILVGLIIAVPATVFAGPVGKAVGGGASIEWQLSVSGHEKIVLSVSTPDGEVYTREFAAGSPVALNLKDLPGVVDGSYVYQLQVVPRIPQSVREQLDRAREAGDDAGARAILKNAGLGEAVVQTGAFSVANGSIVAPDRAEGGKEPGSVIANAVAVSPREGGNSNPSSPARPGTPVTNDQVIPDDLIVQGSLCVGFDCVNNESFGFDTIRLKENNTRIKFDDTSTSAGFPANDWQLTANDSASGGSSKFSIEDITGAKVPFTVTAGASTNSIFVDSTGRVGFRTSTPVLDLHVATGNTPALRLEQNSSGGFTAQTWDIAGNEANFFVRDVTSGSRLPFRIRPGAPTSSIDIAADGDVGVGVASPVGKLDVRGTHAYFGNPTTGSDFMGASQQGIGISNGTEQVFYAVQSGLAFFGSVSATTVGFVTNNSTKMAITSAGDVGIGTLTPTSDLVIANGGTTSSINAGATQFTVASSRTFKENIEPVAARDILSKIESVPVVTYDFKNNGPKNRLGLIAEDFYQVLGRGDEKHIDGQDVQMALWLAVQQLTTENRELKDRLRALESKVTAEK